MKIIGLLFLSTLLASCGQLLDPTHDDSRFHSIRNQFVKDARLFGVNPDMSYIRIAFGDPNKKLKYAGFVTVAEKPATADASCLILQQSNNDLLKPVAKTALGNKYKWKIITISDSLRNQPVEFLEAVVYHELGHCALGLPHSQHEYIMYPAGVYDMKTYRYFYLKELFTRKNFESNALRTFGSDSGIEEKPDLVYEVDYVAFNQRIFHQLYYNKKTNVYFYNENPN